MAEQLGGASTLYICPTCGCPDLMTKSSALSLPAKLRDAQCPNCNWTGKLSEAAGIATTEKVYDTKTILNLLLYVVTKHAAGPIAQAFQFFGLVEKDDQAGLDHIMREATSGLIEKAFMAAAENAAKKGQLAETAKKTCPWCGGRHIIGEEHDFATGEPAHCPKCGGKGELTVEEIAKFEAEEKTKFKVVSGDPTIEPVVEGDELKKNLGKIVEAIESHPLQVQTMLMDQETAKDFGIDVDALNAGAPSVPFPPKMTEENAHLFHVITGEYAPGWQERENAAMPAEKRVLNRLWEHHIRDHVLPEVQRIEKAGQTVACIYVPEYIYLAWAEVYETPKLLGHVMVAARDFKVVAKEST